MHTRVGCVYDVYPYLRGSGPLKLQPFVCCQPGGLQASDANFNKNWVAPQPGMAPQALIKRPRSGRKGRDQVRPLQGVAQAETWEVKRRDLAPEEQDTLGGDLAGLGADSGRPGLGLLEDRVMERGAGWAAKGGIPRRHPLLPSTQHLLAGGDLVTEAGQWMAAVAMA